MKSLPLWAHSAGACGLVSPEMNLLWNVFPLSFETMTFKLSLPSPFQLMYMLPLREANAGVKGLVSPRMVF